MAQKLTPNQYDLQGPGIVINYSVSSLGGQPQLTLKKNRQTLNFSGNEIGVANTPIGDLITVTIAKTVDRGSTTLSVLLPAIELSTASAKQVVRTFGVTTVHKTTIAGPPKGQQESYKVLALRGTARQVAFLTQKSAGA
jgi:hypothetical protein